MSEAHVLQRTLTCEHTIPDPGDDGIIIIDRQFAVVEIVSAAAEERTMAMPTTAGLICTLIMKTDGGSVDVQFSTAFNATGNVTSQFNDVNDTLLLVSVSTSSAYRWQLLVNSGTTLTS